MDYGKYVNYNVNIEDGDMYTGKPGWRIFYSNENYVYLITTGLLPVTKFPEVAPIDTYYTTNNSYLYSAYWPSSSKFSEYSGMQSISDEIANKFMITNYKSKYPNSTYANSKMTAALLDTEKWSSLASGIEGAEAIGSATYEMWVASWNSKGYKQLSADICGKYGYVLDNNWSDASGWDLRNDKGATDTLYFPHKNSMYWRQCLASPMYYKPGQSLANVEGYGKLRGCTYQYWVLNDSGIRPVVAIPANIKVTSGKGTIAEPFEIST